MKPGGGVREYSGIGGYGTGSDRAVVNKPGRPGGTKLLEVACLSTLPCRARIANRLSNQVRRSPAHWGDDGRLRWFLHS
jgi:hypothetical protein